MDHDHDVAAALAELNNSTKATLATMADEIKKLADHQAALEAKASRPRLGGPGGADEPTERKAIEALGEFGRTGEFKSMSAGVDPEGGYMMAPQLAAAIRERAAQVSPIRQIATTIVLTNADSYEEPALTTLGDAQWVSEQGARPETAAPGVAKHTIPTHDLYCNPAVTQRLLDNAAYDVGAALVRRIAKKFAQKEGAAFVSGDGVGKPTGFLSYAAAAVTTDDDARAWGVLQYVASGSAATIADVDGGADGLIDLAEKLAPEYRPNARWVMNRTTAAKVRKLKDADKNYIWQTGIAAGQPAMLLGYPVTIADDMPSEGAGAFPIAFGDFAEGYAVIDAARMTILRDPFTNKPFVHFYTVERVGGDVLDFDAIKLLKCSVS